MIVLTKNPLIKELSGSRIEFFHPPSNDAKKPIVLVGGKANVVRIPFKVKVIAGGKLDLDFVLSEKLAAAAVSMLGAYWDGQEVVLYLMPLSGFDVHITEDVALAVGTLVQVTTYRQVEEGIAGALVKTGDHGVMQVEKKEEKRKATRKGRK
jgi:hypothetical protein